MAHHEPEGPLPHGLVVGLVTPHELVLVGVRAILLQGLADAVVESADRLEARPDVVLYDVFGLHQRDGADLDHWVTATGAAVVALTRELRPDLGALALDRGAAGVVSLSASAVELAQVVRAAAAGTLAASPAAQDAEDATRTGGHATLSQREADVLRLIAQGLSNQEIADRAYLSINSVKTYIRSTYRKINVTNRAQAVVWAMQHGLPADTEGTSTPGGG